MQALLAPLVAAGAGTAAAGAGAAAAAGTAAAAVTPMALVASAAGPVFGAFNAMEQAKSAKEQAKVNSYIGTTRARQTDQAAREGLNSELSNVRAALSANGQRPSVGTASMFDELRSVRGAERRVAFNNETQNAAAYKAKANGISPGMSLTSGLLKAGPSLFDIYDYGSKNNWGGRG